MLFLQLVNLTEIWLIVQSFQSGLSLKYWFDGNLAIRKNHEYLIYHHSQLQFTRNSLKLAGKYGNLETIKFILNNYFYDWSPLIDIAINKVIKYSDSESTALTKVKYLLSCKKPLEEQTKYLILVAASRGYLKLIIYLNKKGYKYLNGIIDCAAKNNHIHIMDYFHYFKQSPRVVPFAVLNNNFEMLQKCTNIEIKNIKTMIDYAVCNGNLQIVEYLIDIYSKHFKLFNEIIMSNEDDNEIIMSEEVLSGDNNHEYNEYLEYNDIIPDTPVIENNNLNYNFYLMNAIRNGHLHIVKRFINEKQIKEKRIAHIFCAASYNQLEILQYLVEHNKAICSEFITELHNEWYFESSYSLEILQYLKTIGLHNYNTLFLSRFANNLEVVKYLYLAGLTFEKIKSKCYDNLLLLQFLHSKQTIFSENAIIIACEFNNLKVVKYLHSLNFNWQVSWVMMIYAIENYNFPLIKYLHENFTFTNRKNKEIKLNSKLITLPLLRYLIENIKLEISINSLLCDLVTHECNNAHFAIIDYLYLIGVKYKITTEITFGALYYLHESHYISFEKCEYIFESKLKQCNILNNK